MESSPSHSPPPCTSHRGGPWGTFLPSLPLIPQYLQTQGLHGAHRRELLREGGGEEREPLKPRPPSTHSFPKTLELSQSCHPFPPRPQRRLTAEHGLGRQERLSTRSPQSSAMFLCGTGRLCSYLAPTPAEESHPQARGQLES